MSTAPRTPAEIVAALPPTQLATPTITGPVRLDVGVSSYGIPVGSRIAHHPDVAVEYVLTPSGGVHVFTEHGELIGVTPQILDAIRRAHFQT